jgi:hypothetical protein
MRSSFDRREYDGQQNGTIYDARGSYPSIDFKHTEAIFSPGSIDSLYLRVAQVPRSRDMAIFGFMTDKQIALPLLRMRTRDHMHSSQKIF